MSRRQRKLKDYTGSTYGRLTAVRFVSLAKEGQQWIFDCACGAQCEANTKSVVSGHTQSCGCLARETLVTRNTTHGLAKLRCSEYRSWKDLRARCNNPNNQDYKDYGGRGIKVCQRWDNFENFYADMGDRPSGMTVDRIDVNGDYEPNNCRWATPTQQANNKRTNRCIEWNGQSKTLMEWSRETGIEHTKARYRLAQGWPLESVFSQEDFRQ